jgi:RHS repeat-associated protein
VPTTTYSYDANGNLIQAGGWSYVWDYLNRMLASGYNNSTTTYAYDPSGARMLQTSTTSTTYYPNKYYSFASTKIGANTYATSTNYIWNGDTLLATIDQPLYNGSATGSPITRNLHPDHLGSTNAVTDQNGGLVQLMDYYPYGATRIATSTYPTNEKRQYIGQFSDAQTSLNYLNARYYNPQQGQFLSGDPVFLGNPIQQNLKNPQSLNTYSYSEDNPITKQDPTGRTSALIPGQGLVYNYNGTNETVCCSSQSAPSGSGTSNKTSVIPPPGTANGFLPTMFPFLNFGASWTPTKPIYTTPLGLPSLFSLFGSASTPVNSNLGSLPIRPSAIPKLEQLSSQTGLSVDEILKRGAQSASGAIDLKNDANINIYQSKPANGELIRITTNPEGDAIISAGTNSINDVTTGAANGRFIPEDPLLFMETPITPDIIIY